MNFTDLSFLACAVFFKEAVWSACFSGFWGVCNKPMFIHRCQSLMLKSLFGSPLVTSLPCAGVSALMFKNLFRRKRAATVGPTDRKHNRVSAA